MNTCSINGAALNLNRSYFPTEFYKSPEERSADVLAEIRYMEAEFDNKILMVVPSDAAMQVDTANPSIYI